MVRQSSVSVLLVLPARNMVLLVGRDRGVPARGEYDLGFGGGALL